MNGIARADRAARSDMLYCLECKGIQRDLELRQKYGQFGTWSEGLKYELIEQDRLRYSKANDICGQEVHRKTAPA